MTELRIPMDPINPGQFYACCGVFELYELYARGGLASFETDPRSPRQACFRLDTPSGVGLDRLMAELRACEFAALDHSERTIAPVRFRWAGRDVVLNWWLNDANTDKHPLKPWAGNQKSAGLFGKLVDALPTEASGGALMKLSVYTTSRLGVDPRSAWNKLDCGYSPNERDVKESQTAPAVDLLAAIGLQGFRPERKRPGAPFRYAVWSAPLPRVVARLAAAGEWAGAPRTIYEFRLLDRGQGYKAFDFADRTERYGDRS